MPEIQPVSGSDPTSAEVAVEDEKLANTILGMMGSMFQSAIGDAVAAIDDDSSVPSPGG